MRVRPTYLIIGEQKAGTGWLRDRLREHPQVYCHAREVNYFNYRRNYTRGPEWYGSVLAAGRHAAAIGEKSPDYFWLNRPSPEYHANPLANIARDLPDARIILSLRNPVDRAISAFNHHLYHRGGRVDPALTRTKPLESLLFDEQPGIARGLGLIERGHYAERLRLARSLFGERLLVLIFEEDIAGDPVQGLRRVCAHIGVTFEQGRFHPRDNRKEHKPSYAEIVAGFHVPVLRPLLRILPLGAPYRVSADPATRARLRTLYAADVASTLQILGRSESGWPAVWRGDLP